MYPRSRAARFTTALGPRLVLAVRDVARLVVPVECPGCGLLDVRWCSDCEAPWWEEPLRSEQGAPRLATGAAALPVWAITELESSAHGMIAAWKDGHRRDLDEFFAQAMTRMVAAIAPHLPPCTVFVPAPARTASTRLRGVDLPLMLARAAASSARAAGLEATALAALSIGRGESRHASARARWTGGARSVERVRELPQGHAVVLVDDVLTTGATLARSAAAAQSPLTPVVAGLVLACAPAPATPHVRSSTHHVAGPESRV